MRQMKPRHNLRDLMRPTISSSFCSACLCFVSLPFLSEVFFSFPNQVRFYQTSPVRNHYWLWNFRTNSGYKACGNHSIGCAHLAQHLYRYTGGFWNGEKRFTKSISEAGLTTDTVNISYNVQLLLDASFLFCACFLLSECTGWLWDQITTLKSLHVHKLNKQIWRGKWTVCWFRNSYQSDNSRSWIKAPEGLKKKSWMLHNSSTFTVAIKVDSLHLQTS